MTQYGPVDPKVIDQAIRNAHEMRSVELYRIVSSIFDGFRAVLSAIRDGVQAGRKAHDVG